MQEFDHEFAQFLYYTPGYLEKEGQLWPVRAGRSIAKPHYKVGPKRIECYSIHFVHEGIVRFEFDGEWIDLGQGDLFCLFPERTYYYCQVPSENPLRLSWLALDGSRVKPLLELSGLTPESPFRKIVPLAVRDSAEQVIQALSHGERWMPASAMKLQTLICGLFADFIPDSALSDAAEPSGWIHECMDFMELHATEGISVQQVAAFAGVHRSYFTSVFTGQVGMSPQKYIQKIRMEKAKRLLKETGATVTEIAMSLGYPNLYSFTRAFTVYHRISPNAFRAAGRE
ncbi:AraC family transcriptional regulator [Cohnella pontilimi]|uniref:AraC family transcriptional regulator n=1 Tax=Cohnella pontilimi TaxID=2564100 RepID=A0A4U0FC89_9BACL|nr:AraC family transcriptional regulator [Cohnella pontilimi]TJY42476.1 AraC family transcriptional regulator [Cohnella pontilimi]